jgi:hypothetical protein
LLLTVCLSVCVFCVYLSLVFLSFAVFVVVVLPLLLLKFVVRDYGKQRQEADAVGFCWRSVAHPSLPFRMQPCKGHHRPGSSATTSA